MKMVMTKQAFNDLFKHLLHRQCLVMLMYCCFGHVAEFKCITNFTMKHHGIYCL